MRVVVPHTPTGLRAETAEAAKRYAPGAEFVVLEDDEAYWRLWIDLWSSRETFVVIEQDIVIHAGVLPQFERCTAAWCTFAYPYSIPWWEPGTVYHGTGCVRFRGSLTAAYPDVIEAVGQREGPKHPPRHWCSNDGFMQLELAALGIQACRHEPPVGHVDPTVSHDCHCSF